jgi:hypothetical protein
MEKFMKIGKNMMKYEMNPFLLIIFMLFVFPMKISEKYIKLFIQNYVASLSSEEREFKSEVLCENYENSSSSQKTDME